MATTGHESELVTVAGLKGTLQQYKTDISDAKLNASLKGVANGVAELDANGKVPSAQLPSFVDDVIEGYYYNSKFYKESAHTTEITGEGGKIYVDLPTNKTYRWSGSAFVVISETIAIGTTTGTAADGKIASDHYGNTTVHITAAERTAWNGKGSYSKPSGGIPKTDLASAVQTSLGLADSALQEHQDISGKADKSATVSTVGYNTTNKKITKTINGSTTDVVTASTIVTDGGGLKSHQTIKQDGVTGATANRFGTCSIAAATAAKTVSITSGTFALEAGARVSVKFENANTADSPTLNVNSKGAKNIFHKGAQITTGGNKALLAGVCDFIYDGTQWHLVGNYIDTNTQTITGVKGNSESTYRTGNVNITAANIGLGNVGNFKAVSTVASQGLTDTEKSNARANIGAGTSSFSGSYNDLSNKPTIPAAANNGVLSIKTKVGTADAVTAADFSANQSAADDVTFIQGSNVTLTTDTTNRTVTIAATDTTYSDATTSASGLMSASDKTKLNGVATGATKVVETTVSGWGFTKNAGTVTGLKVGTGDTISPSSGIITIPAYPTSLPAAGGTAQNVSGTVAVANGGTGATTASGARTNLGLGAAAVKGVTDNSSATAVTSSDTNLITARTLYYAGYTKNAGTVTAVKVNGTTKNPSSGVVDIGTVITSHQDISGKADAATTLAGYGITDAKIDGGVITLGSNTITPLTSHQDISGKQNKVAKLGSTTKPVYTSAAGTFAECSTYAGGTAVTLNGASKAASTASFYAPTGAGTSGQVLMSAGSGAPSWTSPASVEVCQSIVGELT